MGLFDFFKNRKKEPKSSAIPADQISDENSSPAEDVVYKTRWMARKMGVSEKAIEQVVEQMVAEDPFQNFYGGKTDADIIVPGKKWYEYSEITTLNANLIEEGSSGLSLVVEGISLGRLPNEMADEIKPYLGKSMLTAYVFVLGGRYKEYVSETGKVEEGFIPYDLEINLQYS